MAAAKTPPSTIAQVRDVFPKLGEISDKVVFGDVWERKQLAKRDRSLITIAALTALYRPDQLRGHLWRALDNGVTQEEIIEVITHLAFYAGWPNAGTAALIAKQVFAEHGK
jgi:4-carboxymuconolactone decarboxylase